MEKVWTSTDFDQLLTTLNQSELSEAYCNLEEVFDRVRVLPTKSASSTTQAIVKIRPTELSSVLRRYVHRRRHDKKKGAYAFIKFMPFTSDSSNRPDIEIYIYKYLMQELVVPKITPHIMTYVASAYCSKIVNNLTWLDTDELAMEEHVERWFAHTEPDLDPVDLIMNHLSDGKLLILELGKGKSLGEWVKEPDFETQEWDSIAFQVGYTLYEMWRVGIRHNDLHWGNVWMTRAAPGSHMYYKLANGQCVKLPVRYWVKIYDFDLSTFTQPNRPAKMRNQLLDDEMCPDLGLCDAPDPLFDWHTFIAYGHFLYKTAIAPQSKLTLTLDVKHMILTWITMTVKDITVITKDYRHFARYCLKQADDTCDPTAMVPPEKLKSFYNLVDEGYFSRFVISTEDYQKQVARHHPHVYHSGQ